MKSLASELGLSQALKSGISLSLVMFWLIFTTHTNIYNLHNLAIMYPSSFYHLTEINSIIIEGLCAKRAYIGFLPTCIFCRIELIFGRLTCFDMKSIVP